MSTFWAASEKFVASKADQQIDLQRTTEIQLVLTSDVTTLTTSQSDLAGLSYTFDTDTVGATYTVFTTWDYTPGSLLIGKLNVNGVALSPEAHCEIGRNTIPQNYHGTLTYAGSHTIKMTAAVTSSAGTLFANHTTMLVQIREAI